MVGNVVDLVCICEAGWECVVKVGHCFVWIVGAFVPVASNLEPTKPKGQESPNFLNILNKEALLRIAQISYQKETHATHAHALPM
jgi:hypothetical protein